LRVGDVTALYKRDCYRWPTSRDEIVLFKVNTSSHFTQVG